MSASRNSRRGTKRAHAGVEIWSARPTHYGMANKGHAHYKRDTHRAERRQANAEIKESTYA